MIELYCQKCKTFVLKDNVLYDWTCERCWTEVVYTYNITTH
jgi:PHP family Zn ribbon phosphoesterase